MSIFYNEDYPFATGASSTGGGGGIVQSVSAISPVFSTGGVNPVISIVTNPTFIGTVTATGAVFSPAGSFGTLSWTNGFGGTLQLATPLGISYGGTGTASPALVAGSSIGITGAWPDQTVSVAGLLAIANGGTGTSTPSLVAGSGIAISGSWPNQTVTTSGASATAVISVSATAPASSTGGQSPTISINTPIAISFGGTGTATPGLVAGSGIAISGSWPNQTVTTTGASGSAVISVSASSPLSSTGGSAPTISVVSNPTFVGHVHASTFSTPNSNGILGQYNVLDYGATGTSTSADASGINAAVQAALSAGGGTVFVPAVANGAAGCIYALASSISLYPGVSMICDGSVTFAPYGGMSSSAVIFTGPGGYNFKGERYTFGRFANFGGSVFPGIAAGIQVNDGTSYIDCSFEEMVSCQYGVAMYAAGTAGIFNNTFNFNDMRDCTYGIILYSALNALYPSPFSQIQGSVFRGNILIGCDYSITFDGPGGYNTDVSANYFDINVVNGRGNVYGAGIAYINGIGIRGGNTFRIPNFGGFSPGSSIAVAGGSSFSQQTFEIGPYEPQPGYANYNLNTGGGPSGFPSDSAVRCMLPYYSADVAATTSSNTRSSFNGGVPLFFNRIPLSLTIPSNMTVGQTVNFYAYSPFVTGDRRKPQFQFQESQALLLVSTVEDESIYTGNDSQQIANQIHIQLAAVGTVPSGTVVYGTLEVGT